jgi:hypothetical protein
VPENKLQERRPGTKREKVPWSWTDWEIMSFVCSINCQLLMRVITQRMTWAGHVANIIRYVCTYTCVEDGFGVRNCICEYGLNSWLSTGN